MNKLYILGALALANVDAALTGAAAQASGIGIYALTYTLPTTGLGGSYTYTTTGDCFASGTATSLGMNNIYHQYYSFALTKGTNVFSTIPLPATPAAIILITTTASYSGCYHSHLYNWMAQPQLAATTVTAGFGNAVVAYGYAMTGTVITSCSSATIVTTTLFKSNIFTGAQFQSSILTWTSAASVIANANAVAVWGKVGPGLYVAKAVSALSFITIISSGLAGTTSQNAYWDFMQTNIYMGMTQFGRGGGASTAPCGWWVVYAWEDPAGGATTSADTINTIDDQAVPTINMWTDNSVVKAASAFVLTALAGLLF